MSERTALQHGIRIRSRIGRQFHELPVPTSACQRHGRLPVLVLVIRVGSCA